MIRSIIFFISFFPCILACKHAAKKEFEVKGTVKNTNDKMVYLQETPLGSGQRIIEDSSEIKSDGSFQLKGKAGEESLFSLILSQEAYPFAYVINDASEIIVNADTKNQNDYEVKGSAASKSLKEFSIASSAKWIELYRLGQEMDSLKKSGATDSVLLLISFKGEAQLKDLQDYVGGYIKNSSDPITCAWALGSYEKVFSMNDYQVLLNSVVKKFPNHKGIATVKEMNDRQQALVAQKSQEPRDVEWVNKEAPNLSLPDMNGHEIKLSSFKGKYVLVDFWASWCLPCRQENPNVVTAYNKYKNKNFAILGVSLDKEKDDWANAVQKDNLSWTQVSDLQEWNSLAVATFGFTGIPFNVLIDPKGKIIAQNLRGEELENKLEEVLK
ncbi:MAG TPA: TlpA disulfide reductase family protein [Chitinophagaceae bacterium]|nr:TlpA disulfide reductase family protein [Chitinophagaceae bacterium]